MRQFEKIEIEFDSVEDFKKEYPQLVLDVAIANKDAQDKVKKYKENQPPF